MYPGTPAQQGTNELDDLLAEMSGTTAVESAGELDERTQAFVGAMWSGADADPLAVPDGPHPSPVMPGITAESGLFDRFSPAEVATVLAENNDLDRQIVQHLVQRGGLDISPANLSDTLTSIRHRRLELIPNRPPVDRSGYDEIIRAMAEDGPNLPRLRELVDDKELTIPLAQAAAVLHFLDTYPEFWPKLDEKAKRITFNSSLGDTRGGGLFDSRGTRQIYMSRLLYTPPGSFVRLVVHELGHAAFEAILLDHVPMPHNVDIYEVSQLLQPPGENDLPAEAYWDGMSPLAKSYYRAWLTLREHDGQHLFGTDLWEDPAGNRLSPTQRHEYQASSFGEFCAETFMQFAMGDLHPHVSALLQDPDIEHTVKTAWQRTWAVLTKVALPILGPRHG